MLLIAKLSNGVRAVQLYSLPLVQYIASEDTGS